MCFVDCFVLCAMAYSYKMRVMVIFTCIEFLIPLAFLSTVLNDLKIFIDFGFEDDRSIIKRYDSKLLYYPNFFLKYWVL